jgi:cytochrome c-type biogenesis protein CcmH/NrfG
LKNTDAAKDPAYLNALGKMYVRTNRTQDSADAFKKADQLQGK